MDLWIEYPDEFWTSRRDVRYPKKRTFRHLLDYLVCALLQKQWHVQPEGLGGLEVDDQLKFGRLFDWQVSRKRGHGGDLRNNFFEQLVVFE
jgi:hypothetical protein